MCETLTTTSRRVLNFPAIQPSDEVSPYTLVDSLVHLAAKICGYRSKFFASNERNARESTRQIGVLLLFLEEIRDSAAELPDCVVLSLSELHVAFQKLRFLLEDCLRDGARVWMLAKSELVAGLFRSLMRSISTVMELFPIDRIEVGEEMRQHVELAMKQARESRFDFDSEDESFLMIVHSVLFGFESGVIPDRDVLKQVLDYLRIKSWSKCHEEAKFLESETELESQKRKGRTEASFLSSLTGFVCYCRCTAFEEVDAEPIRRSNRERQAGRLLGINEDDLRCPISLEIMSDPVAIASGHSYDRVSIAKWFAAGNSTCPKTGEKLLTTDMVPNPALRRLIQLYCLENGVEIPNPGHRNRTRSKREAFPLSSAAKKAAELSGIFLAEALQTGPEERKNRAAREVRVLSKSSGFNRSRLVESGAVAPLLRLSSESSAAALLNLSKSSEAREEIFRLGGSEVMARLVRDGPGSEARQHAAGVLFYLASTDDRRASIGSCPDSIPGLVGLIRNGPNRGKKNALAALFALLAHQDNVWRALSAGIVDVLADVLASSVSGDFAADSLAILSVLAEDFDGAGTVIGFINSAIEILNSSESRCAKEQSVSLLLALCKNQERDVVYVLAKSKAVMGSLYSLLTQGTSRAGKKASELIRILHDFNERRSSGMLAPIRSQERVNRAW